MAAQDNAAFVQLCTDAIERAGVTPLDAEQSRLLGLSEFLVRSAQRSPAEFQQWLAARVYANPLTQAQIQAQLDALAARHPPDGLTLERLPELQRDLREVRNLAQRHLIWRHLSRRAEYAEIVASLSALADAVLSLALSWCDAICVAKEGAPHSEAGERQQLVVLALGKLGGGELNLSSDIDLICAYPESGKTLRTGKTNQQFFVRLVQLLVKVVGEVTGDGFAFRVDLRLRPFGDSGALVQHFSALENYYEANGRDWERYALIKARPCAGDLEAGAALMRRLQPFVFRRYLDFAAIAALREMRALIRSDQSTHATNVKLGAGGIRDIEFLAQMLQLVWGGRVPALRGSSLAATLDALVAQKLLDAAERQQLWAHYCLFRDVEHCLQAFRDEQTHSLPTGPEQAQDRLRLSVAMGCADFDELDKQLEAARAWVLTHLTQWLHDDDAQAEGWGLSLWRDDVIPEDLLSNLGPASDRLRAVLAELREAALRAEVSAVGGERLDALMPVLLEDLFAAEVRAEGPTADIVLLRLAPLLHNVLRRSAYLVLLTENAPVRRELAKLARSGEYFPGLLAKHPALMDELLLRESGTATPTVETLQLELATLLPDLDEAGEVAQAHFDALARFKSQHQFRGLLSLLRGDLSIMQLGDYFTLLAEVVIECVLGWAWRSVGGDAQAALTGFVVVGYGKLGGHELGAHSDLDLVFIHDWPLARHGLLHNLVRRFLNFIGMQTYFGQLFEVDVRLRPAGRDGLLVSTLQGFEKYQRHSAWVWEHQALVRARVVAGCGLLAEQFAELRRQILMQPRAGAELLNEVQAMRERMRASVAQHAVLADLKKGEGGIVDVEFMVQYIVLRWAAEFPELLEFPDNARILEIAERLGLITTGTAATLIADYASLRRAGELLKLLDRRGVEREGTELVTDLVGVRRRVSQHWQRLMAAP